MKKIFYLAFFSLVVVMGFSSCSLKEDDNFDIDASVRAAERIDSVRQILYTAPNGWLMEYYGNLNFGGYNMMVKFDKDQATIGGEKFALNHFAGLDTEGKAITSTSHFKLEQSMGTILSFDGYNDTFHYFSMPNNPDYRYDVADGLYGDFEFRVMSASADSIILRGKKHNNRIKMTPIPAEQSWESIITSAQETQDFMSARSYMLTGADRKDTVDIKVTNNGNFRCLIFEYKDSMEMKQTIAAPYIVKADGYHFYTPVEVNGMTLDGLERGTSDEHFLFHNNNNLQLDAVIMTVAESFRSYTWYMVLSDMGDYGKGYWNEMLEKLKKAGPNGTDIKVYTSTIGLDENNKLTVRLTTSLDDEIWNNFSIRKIDENEGKFFTLRHGIKDADFNEAGREYYNTYGWDKCLWQFFGEKGGGNTFDLECDNVRNPSYIILKDRKNKNNVIRLHSSASYFVDREGYYND